MPDVVLRSGEANPSDVRLYGPVVLASGGLVEPAPALAGTATQTNHATGGLVEPAPALAGTATVTSVTTTFCDYDFAGDTYDNPDDTYDCGALAQPPSGLGYFDRGPDRPRPKPTDDDEEALLVALILRRRFRL